jgi:hypothetical protein
MFGEKQKACVIKQLRTTGLFPLCLLSPLIGGTRIAHLSCYVS